MAEPARDKTRDAWKRTALLCAVITNSNPFRQKGSKPASIDDFDPFAKRKKSGEGIVVSMDVAQELFCGPRPKTHP